MVTRLVAGRVYDYSHNMGRGAVSGIGFNSAIGLAYGEGDVDRMIDVRDAQCPMGHMGDAWDVAHAALFLTSDEAKYITGAELVVDGGLSCRFAKSRAAPALFPHAKTGLGCRRNRESRTRPASRTPGLTGLG